MIGQTISHYRILEKLGEGGMGVVYKAQDTKLDRLVALKFLPQHLIANEAEQARFLQEAKSASALNHPNVCTIYGIEEHERPATAGKQQFIEMEYVDGVTLRQKFSGSPLKITDVLSYAIQIGEALQEAHSKGIVHRDIKSDNIMVNTKNQVKVMDFGLAKLKGSLKLTRTSSTVGTLAYMAPEQIQGGDVDARSDIFSFGVVLFEMLTGRIPFRGEHEAAMVYSIVNEEPDPLLKFRPDASPDLQRIINRTLEKDPEDRYQSVADLVSELRRLQKQSTKVSRKSLSEMPVYRSDAERGVSGVADSKKSKGWISGKRLWIGFGIGLALIVAMILMMLPRLSQRPGGTLELNPSMTFRVLKVPFLQIYYPGLSPDGNWVAFPAVDAGGRWDVYFMNTAGGEPRRVTSDSSVFMEQADVSHDGSQIAYDRFNIRTQKFEICLVSSLGGLTKRIVEGGVVPRWRSDGQRIGYFKGVSAVAGSASDKHEFWSIKPDGSENRLEFVDSASIVRGSRFSFSWSPDGKAVAWLHSFPGGYQEVIVHDLETGNERQLTYDKKVIDEVCWTRNDEIVFSSTKTGNTNLWIVPASGGPSVQLTKGSGPDIGMKISADGKKLLYLQQQVVGHLWIAKLDGSSAKQVTFDDQRITSASFSPDGKQVLCAMGDPDPLQYVQHIYVMDRDGNNRRQLTSGDEIAFWAGWSPNDKWISFSSRSITEPQDSSRIYLMEAANPGSPRALGIGLALVWTTSKNFVLLGQTSSLAGSIEGGSLRKFSEDSTIGAPILSEKYIFFYDFHKGREGFWITDNPPSSAKPRMLVPGVPRMTVAPNQKFMLYLKGMAELWKKSLPDGREERIQGTFPGLGPQPSFAISNDGKEIIYVDARLSSKLVMIENLH